MNGGFWNELLNGIAAHGPWALLFVFLLTYVLQQNAQREKKYQEIIETLTTKLELIEEGFRTLKENVKEDIRDLKECILRRQV